jgi:hypothetical protein
MHLSHQVPMSLVSMSLMQFSSPKNDISFLKPRPLGENKTAQLSLFKLPEQ